MRDLIDQLDSSLAQPLYFLSLFTALAVPDIAGALDSDDGLANGGRYGAWYDKWAKPQFGKILRATLPPQVAALTGTLDPPMTGEAC